MKKQRTATGLSLVHFGTVLVVVVSALALEGCAKINRNAPQYAKSGPLSEEAGRLATAGTTADDGSDPIDGETAATKAQLALIKKIIQDQRLGTAIRNFEKKNKVVCTRIVPGQIHWFCTAGTLCKFAIETTCVSNIVTTATTVSGSNNEILRLAFWGETNSKTSTYKLPLTASTVDESLPQTVKFEPKTGSK